MRTNDVKTALKASKSQAWRTVLEMTLVANLNYGPFGSSAWHFKKKARLEEFLNTNSTSDPSWSKYQPLVCKERRIAEPTDFEESQDLFQSLKAMDSFATKGPLIKLMRWFSWFESMLFYHGEMWATKMVLEATDSLGEAPASEQEVEERPQEHKDPQKELQALKKRQGSWKLAPKLINHKNMAVKDCITVCQLARALGSSLPTEPVACFGATGAACFFDGYCTMCPHIWDKHQLYDCPISICSTYPVMMVMFPILFQN